TARLPPPLVLGIPLHRLPAPPPATLLPYTTLFRSAQRQLADHDHEADEEHEQQVYHEEGEAAVGAHLVREAPQVAEADGRADRRSEEHTSELQSRFDLVCRLLLEKKKARANCAYRQ